jgi:hypothetical protein
VKAKRELSFAPSVRSVRNDETRFRALVVFFHAHVLRSAIHCRPADSIRRQGLWQRRSVGDWKDDWQVMIGGLCRGSTGQQTYREVTMRSTPKRRDHDCEFKRFSEGWHATCNGNGRASIDRSC